VLALWTHDEERARDAALGAGFDAGLRLPVSADHLAEVIRLLSD
jgi:DNA-binding NarL/FixJ family response regulator